MLDTLDLAALAGYGSDWEDVGKAALLARMVPLFSRRPAGVGSARRAAGAMSRGAASVNKGVVAGAIATLVVAAAVVYVISAGTFSETDAPRPVSLPISHTPVPQIGPIIPTLSPTPGPNPDRTKPSRPTGLHVTGRSQTAVSLDWNASTDNIKVVGYAISRNNHRVGTSYTPGYTAAELTADTAYQFSVLAFDAFGNLSPSSTTVTALTLRERDTSPPSTPTGLHAVGITTTSIALDWNPSHDDVGVAGYDVFRDGSRIATVPRSAFTDTGLSPNTKHTYMVRAYDTTNNASSNSGSYSVTTSAVVDKTPPTTPSALIVTGTSTTSVTLSWGPSTDPNGSVAGYNVYETGVAGPLLSLVSGTSTTVTGLTPKTTYTFWVKAQDKATNESGASNTVSPTTDTPPVQPAVTDVSLSKSGVSSTCTTQVTATITAVGGLASTDVTFSGSGFTTVTVQNVDVSGGTGTATVNGDETGAVSGLTATTSVGSVTSGSVSWSVPSECVAEVKTVDPFDASDITAPDCTTTLTTTVHAGFNLDHATLTFTGDSDLTGTIPTTVSFDSSGDGTVTLVGDGNADGDVTMTATGGGNSVSREVTWSQGAGCPVGP